MKDVNSILADLGLSSGEDLPVTEVPLAEAFVVNTALALKAQRDILTLRLDDDDPHYKSKLAAKSSTATAQIGNQLKSDETRLKALATASYYEELKAEIAAVKARFGSDD